MLDFASDLVLEGVHAGHLLVHDGLDRCHEGHVIVVVHAVDVDLVLRHLLHELVDLVLDSIDHAEGLLDCLRHDRLQVFVADQELGLLAAVVERACHVFKIASITQLVNFLLSSVNRVVAERVSTRGGLVRGYRALVLNGEHSVPSERRLIDQRNA